MLLNCMLVLTSGDLRPQFSSPWKTSQRTGPGRDSHTAAHGDRQWERGSGCKRFS